MSKAIPIMAIIVAFVSGTLVSGVVYADDKNGKPFEAIWDAIHILQSTPSNGITDVYQKQNPQNLVSPGGLVSIDVRTACDPGHVVLGGGVEFVDGISILADKPDGVDGWLGTFQIGSVNPKAVNVYAICAIP